MHVEGSRILSILLVHDSPGIGDDVVGRMQSLHTGRLFVRGEGIEKPVDVLPPAARIGCHLRVPNSIVPKGRFV